MARPLSLAGWLLAGLFLAWLAVAQLPGRSLFDLDRPGLSPARWIWPEGPRDRRSPLAFWAVADFAVTAPRRAVTLEVIADEEYVAYLDGRRVGFGRFSAQRGLDAWTLAEGLEVGSHRLLIEVRSGRGAGGLLARLVADDGEVLAASGEAWRIERRAEAGVLAGWLPVETPEGKGVTLSWGPPVVGRWQDLGVRSPRPAWPLATAEGFRLPVRARLVGEAESWRQRGETATPIDLREPVPGVIFDFGAVVSGVLHLELGGGENVRCALAFLSDRPSDPFTSDGVGEGALVRPVVPVPGNRRWQAAEAVSFRYVTVLGAIGGATAWLEPAAADGEEAEAKGPLGLSGPRLRTPIEDEIRRELQRFPGLTGAEEL
ncbi:MAG: hypothetical protein AAF604_21935 [Acidobacteriota bacterium]